MKRETVFYQYIIKLGEGFCRNLGGSSAL